MEGDDHACREAVKADVVGDRCGDVLGLGIQFCGRVFPRHDDPGADVSKLAGDRFGEPRRIALFAQLPVQRVVAPDDAIVGLDRAGQMDIVDRGMIDQGLADLRVTFEGHEQSFFEKGSKGLFEDRF